MNPLTRFSEIRDSARHCGKKRVAVVCAEQEATLKAVLSVSENGFAEPIFCGRKAEIETLIKQIYPKSAPSYEIMHTEDPEESAGIAISLVKQGNAEVLVKGAVSTATLLKKVFSKDGIRTKRLVSDVNLMENPDRAGPPLLCVTDGGINIAPNLEKKIEIVKNAVAVYHALGYERPKVALLSAIEKKSPAVQSSVDAEEITLMAKDKTLFPNADVYGPLAIDVALFKDFAEKKGVTNPVAGNADILVVPSIEAGNILAKWITFFDRAEHGQVVIGTQVPMIIPSRSDRALARINSLALAFIIADKIEFS